MLFEEMVTFHQYFSPQRVNALLHYSLGFHIPQIFKSVTWYLDNSLGYPRDGNEQALLDRQLTGQGYQKRSQQPQTQRQEQTCHYSAEIIQGYLGYLEP